MPPDKEWYSRGYLPHRDRPGLVQAITMRLVDSMPVSVRQRWTEELAGLTEIQRQTTERKRIAAYLDAGYGACWLKQPQVAEIVESALLHFDGGRYGLIAWVVMPNHLHVLAEFQESLPLGEVVRSWKIWTARRANDFLRRTGPFWHREYHDRYIRDGGHLEDARAYIENNPVKAGLCRSPEQWRWSSAWHRNQA